MDGASDQTDEPASLPWHVWANTEPGDPGRVELKIDSLELQDGSVVTPLTSGVTVFVGANNTGKSTVLRQLHLALSSGNESLRRQRPTLVRRVNLHREFQVNDLVSWLGESAVFSSAQPTEESHFMRRGHGFGLSTIHQIMGGVESGLNLLAPQLVFFADASGRLAAQLSVGARSSVTEPPSTPLHQFQDDRGLFEALNSLSRQVFAVPLLFDDFSGGTVMIRVGSVELPVPGRQEPLGAFGIEVGRLPSLDTQGDGMRSFFGLMVPLIADSYSTVLVDEPEAFLHPPQARALGTALADIAARAGTQVLLATHDKDLIAGLLASSAAVTVVRLVREADLTTAVQLHEDRLKEVWDDRTLRYTNVLDGLFSKMVVVAEAEQDCRFYEAAFDSYAERFSDDKNVPTVPSTDVLFVPSGGKSGVRTLLSVLRDLAVPTICLLDIDVLEHPSPLEDLVMEAGGDWDQISRWRNVVASSVNDWKLVKKVGDRAFSGDQRKTLDLLLTALDELGILVVRVGELEGFAPQHPKDKRWLLEALSEDAHSTDAAVSIVSRAMSHYARVARI